jgi:hypothetical protein
MYDNKQRVINNILKWDGEHLGNYIGSITQKWSMEGDNYFAITLPKGWKYMGNEMEQGIIYCMATNAKDAFPCIVEDIKQIFGITRRGLHRIKIDNKEYIIYYVPINIKGDVIWETPLNRLDSKHELRNDKEFKNKVQRLLLFCDILSLNKTGEPMIRIRPGADLTYIPINYNTESTIISRNDNYDYCIISKVLFMKWFGETASLDEIVKDMVGYKKIKINSVIPIITNNGELTAKCAEIRNKIDKIIEKYDGNYIWYSYFIVDKISRYLLMNI